MRKLIFISLIIASITLSGCNVNSGSIDAVLNPKKSPSQSSDINNKSDNSSDEVYKLESIQRYLSEQFFQKLPVGESKEFKVKKIIMKNQNAYYFEITYNAKDIMPNYVQDNYEHTAIIETKDYNLFDICYTDDVKEAVVNVKNYNGRIAVKMILPKSYKIEATQDKRIVSMGDFMMTQYDTNSIIYSK